MKAIAVYDDVIAGFGDATEPMLREQVARALLNKGAALAELDRFVEAIAGHDDIVARFGDATEPVLREQVARALLNKGGALGELDRFVEAIAGYDDVVARFGDATNPPAANRSLGRCSTRARRSGSWIGPWRRLPSMTTSSPVSATAPNRPCARRLGARHAREELGQAM